MTASVEMSAKATTVWMNKYTKFVGFVLIKLDYNSKKRTTDHLNSSFYNQPQLAPVSQVEGGVAGAGNGNKLL